MPRPVRGGRPPYPLVTMLRIHLIWQRYSLSNPAMEEALGSDRDAHHAPPSCRDQQSELRVLHY